MAIALGVRSTKKARRSALGRDVAMTLAATEYDRVVTVFEECTTEQWEMATVCTGWDVRAMAGEVGVGNQPAFMIFVFFWLLAAAHVALRV